MDWRHAEQVAKEPEAAFGLGRKELDAAEMGDIVQGFGSHLRSPALLQRTCIDLRQNMII